MIFESHAHYDDEAFDGDREILLESLKENQVDLVINVGASLDSCKKTIDLMDRYSFIYGALGIHPSDITELNEENYQWLKKQLGRDKVVAVGEIGLDYYWPEPSHDIQKVWFEKQLELAKEAKLPLIIHSRDAAKDTLDIMKDLHAEEVGGVIHCFSYGVEMAREFLQLGYFLGIGGVVTFQNAKKLKETVKYIPMDRLVIETDSPYLAPVPNRGKRNSSLNLPFIAKEIAIIKEMDYEDVIAITEYNAKNLFKKAGQR